MLIYSYTCPKHLVHDKALCIQHRFCGISLVVAFFLFFGVLADSELATYESTKCLQQTRGSLFANLMSCVTHHFLYQAICGSVWTTLGNCYLVIMNNVDCVIDREWRRKWKGVGLWSELQVCWNKCWIYDMIFIFVMKENCRHWLEWMMNVISRCNHHLENAYLIAAAAFS